MVSQEPSSLYHDSCLRVIRIIIACMVLSGIFFTARVASRIIKRVPFIASDYVLLVALVTGWTVSGIIIWGTKEIVDALYALDANEPSTPGFKNGLKSVFLSSCLGTISLGSVKISILLLYRWIFPGKRFHLISLVIGGIVVGWMIAGLFTTIFTCDPIHGYWDYDLSPAPKCINSQRFFIGLAIPNVATDIAILCLPMKKVWNLQMDHKLKVGLTCMFLVGTCTIAITIVRFATLFRVNRHDETTLGDLSIWTVAELTAAVACACLPTLRPLLQKLNPESVWRLRSTLSNPSKYDHAVHADMTCMNDTSALRSPTCKEHGDKFLRLEDELESAIRWSPMFPSSTSTDSDDNLKYNR